MIEARNLCGLLINSVQHLFLSPQHNKQYLPAVETVSGTVPSFNIVMTAIVFSAFLSFSSSCLSFSIMAWTSSLLHHKQTSKPLLAKEENLPFDTVDWNPPTELTRRSPLNYKLKVKASRNHTPVTFSWLLPFVILPILLFPLLKLLLHFVLFIH